MHIPTGKKLTLNTLKRPSIPYRKLKWFSVVFLLFFFIDGQAHMKSDILTNTFKYIVCLHGAESTSLQILNLSGEPLGLEQKDRSSSTTIIGPCSNINIVGSEGFEQVLHTMLFSLTIGKEKIPFSSIQKDCLILGGFAGLSSSANLQKAKSIFEKNGFLKERLILCGDVHLARELVENKGIICIAGFGSVALGVDGNKEMKAGGFGRVLGDEGSSYAIGIHAIKASLEDEYGYGLPTCLTDSIKNFYNVKKVSDLITSINNGEITVTEITELASTVFLSAQTGDLVSNAIILEAARDLSVMVSHVVKQLQTSETIPILLLGNLFHEQPLFIEQVFEFYEFIAFLEKEQKTITVVNISGENIATLVAQKKLIPKLTPLTVENNNQTPLSKGRGRSINHE
ncbi:MAG: hypothetical protein K2Y01_07165 [Rhabdochlamydiaceae bacterium]|nr:hypothetical protein [Rhabdochlamydiaceae bacterium]